jgi:S1-C subfamily serine protease
MRQWLILPLLALMIGCAAATAEAPPAAPAAQAVDTELSALVERVYPAYVFIGGGSGVCVSPDGYFVTNHHVWPEAAAPGEALVRMAGSSRRFTARAVGADSRGDIVLGKLQLEEGQSVPFAPLGDSDAVRIGDLVFCIGNPFMLAGAGSEPTVTLGTVTGKGRFMGGYNDAIQIDTPINPGNSGGPAFNVRGEVIGINGRNISSHQERFNTGAGIAIPATQVRNFLDAFKAQEGGALLVRHGLIGGLGLDMNFQGGARVTSVESDTDAWDAGLRAGDVIIAMDGKPVFNGYRFYGIVGTRPRGEAFALRVRRGGQELELSARNSVPVETGQFSAIPRSDDEARAAPLAGLMQGVIPFRIPDVKSSLGMRGGRNPDRAVGGLVVTEVTDGGPMQNAGLLAGDVLTHLSGRGIHYFADVHDILIATEPGTVLTARVLRGGVELELTVTAGPPPSPEGRQAAPRRRRR